VSPAEVVVVKLSTAAEVAWHAQYVHFGGLDFHTITTCPMEAPKAKPEPSVHHL
jgi:hypothetical protein